MTIHYLWRATGRVDNLPMTPELRTSEVLARWTAGRPESCAAEDFYARRYAISHRAFHFESAANDCARFHFEAIQETRLELGLPLEYDAEWAAQCAFRARIASEDTAYFANEAQSVWAELGWVESRLEAGYEVHE